MGFNSYLNNVNSIIGENARFARQYQANSQSTSGQSQSSTTQSSNTADTQNNPMMSMLSPMIMLMLFQLLSQMMPNLQNGGSPLGNGLYPPPLPDPIPNNSVPLQNPAYQFINNQLTGAGASQQPSGNSLDFTDDASIKNRISCILSESTDPTASYLASIMETAPPDSSEFVQCKLQGDALLQREGRDPQELDMLVQALSCNSVLKSLSNMQANTYDPSIASRISNLTQTRTDLATRWNQTYGDVTSDSPDTLDLTTSVQTALHQGQFTEAQLGQSLKYMLDKSPDGIADQAATLLTNLMESGDLNVTPFLTNDYLTQLSPDRRQLLLESVETSGLRMAGGKPNNRFIGFMLDQLGRSDNPTTKQFLQQFLQDFYNVYGRGADANSPVGDTLASILKLAGVQADQSGQLVFS